MRFPPFDAPSHNPEELPVAEVAWKTTPSDTEFTLGNEQGWFIHRKINDTPPQSVDICSPNGAEKETADLLKTRQGWALSPHPLHSIARKWIPYGVTILIIAIVLHVLEPVLINWGIISNEFAGSINLGLLDYPIMFVMASPFVVIPIVLRVVANVEDIRRQHKFKQNPLPNIDVEVEEAFTHGPVKIKIDMPEVLRGREITGVIRVGLLPPHRDVLMRAYRTFSNGRPPVGLSTPLPEGWMPLADDGSGVGETTPMLVGHGAARLFEEPMRIQASGKDHEITIGETVEMSTPEGNWPGSEYGALVNINWELVLKFQGKAKAKTLFWVEKLNVTNLENNPTIECLIADSGRLEMK